MAAAPLLRVYASARQRLLSLSVSVYNVAADGIALLSLGRLKPTRRKPPVSATVDLSQVLRVLIQVHGTQMLLDGVYNADPHPGNVVVLEDGGGVLAAAGGSAPPLCASRACARTAATLVT